MSRATLAPRPPSIKAALRWWPRAVELICRAGYVARGFVYVSIGFIALLAALGLTPRAKGMMAALEAWSDWPLGFVLLWLTGLGLYGFAAWRAIQSLLDADNQGTGPRAIAARIGQAISGLTYGVLAISVFGLVDALEDLNEADDQAKTRAAVEQMMAMPGGELLVMLVGLFVFGCGVGNLVQAVARDFCERMKCDPALAARAGLLGRVGHIARGIVFIVAGVFMIQAGLHARSGEAKSTGAALDWLAARPMGEPGLALIALGLIAFGFYAFFEARFRTLSIRSALS